MTLKRLFLLVIGTVCIGLALGYITALTGLLGEVRPFRGFITGGFVSATSLMGFWAYLTLNFIMRGFVSFRVWSITQVVLLIIVYIDMIILRHDLHGPLEPYTSYFLFATVPLAAAACVAFVKAKVSGNRSFIPAVFYLYVVTVIEWIPGLKISPELHLQIQMGIVLFGCNTFLLLILNKAVKPPTRIEGKSC